MKTIKLLFIVMVSALFITSCGYHHALVGNLNTNVTNVELSRQNFKVIDKVSGTSTATYIFGIGGLSNRALIQRAKANMLRNADLTGNARAIVNLVTENHVAIFYPVFFRRTVTVSGHIVEFYE